MSTSESRGSLTLVQTAYAEAELNKHTSVAAMKPRNVYILKEHSRFVTTINRRKSVSREPAPLRNTTSLPLARFGDGRNKVLNEVLQSL